MAVLQYKDPITGQMVDLPVASYGIKDAPKDGEQYVRQDATWTKVKSSEPFVNAEYGKILKEAMESQSITQDNYNLLLNALASSSNGLLFCEYEFPYGRLYFTALPTDSGDILVYMNVQMAHVPEPSFMSGAMTISSDLTVTNNTSSSITLSTSGDGSKFLADDGEYKEINTGGYVITWLANSTTGSVTQDQYYELLNAHSSNTPIYVKISNSFYTTYAYYSDSYIYLQITGCDFGEAFGPYDWVYRVSSQSWERQAYGYLTTEDIDPLIASTLRSYTTATTVASLDVDYESIYVTLTANASLSASATGADYNGRTITAYVYTAAAMTITIPTTGYYVSMCGSSFTTTVDGWVEFNLTCIDGKWHIAKLEQEEVLSTNPT